MHKKSLLLCSYLSLQILTAQSAENDFFAQNYRIQERLARGLVFDVQQDKQGFMWFATEFGLIQYDGSRQKIYKHHPGDEKSLAGNVITALANTASGDMWVGTMSNGLHFFDRKKDQFIRYQYDATQNKSLSFNKVEKILVRQNGEVWVSTDGGGVNLFDAKTQGFRRFQKPEVGSNFSHGLLEDSKGKLWLGTYHGLEKWHAQTQKFIPVEGIRRLHPPANVLKAMVEDSMGGIWLGMRDGGLFYFKQSSHHFSRIKLSPDLMDEASENHIWEILPDRQGNIWLATDGGLFHLRRPPPRQDLWQVSTLQLSANKRVLSLFESKDGVIWVGTNEGVFALVPKQKQFGHYQVPVSAQNPPQQIGISCLSPAEDNQIWVGTIRGLFQFSPVRRTFHQDFFKNRPALTRFKTENLAAVFQDSRQNLWLSTISGFNSGFKVFCLPKSTNTLLDFSDRCLPFRSHVTFKITEDDSGNLWFANGSGLVRYFTAQDSLQVFPHDASRTNGMGSNYATLVFFSKHSGLWVGTNDAGLEHFNPQGEIFQHFRPDPKNTSSISHERVLNLFEDQNHNLWLGTEGGLNVMDPQRKTFRAFDTRHGLAETHVNGIVQDEGGFIWLSTQHHLARYDLQQNRFTNYDKQDGIGINEFWDRTSFRDSYGQLYFGGDNGLLVFKPEHIRSNAFVPPIVFTDFLLSNRKVKPEPGKKLLPTQINFTQKITLSPGQNIINLHFAALSFIRPNKNKYAIQLKGFENKWQYIGTRTNATYTNLDPGRYTFCVRAANNDGVWNEEGAKLQLVVLPPWWRTIWAMGGFALLLGGLVLGAFRFQIRRKLAQAEAHRLVELDAFKTRFYTNITHEFRSPLTLILGPVEHALNTRLPLDSGDLGLIQNSGRRLLKLVNQMLDLSKLDAGSLKIDWIKADIVVLLRYVLESFHSLAAHKNIRLELMAEPPSIIMDFDKEKTIEIASNLLSNALKFTPEGGLVRMQLSVQENFLLLNVKDSGMGIPEEHIAQVFDRFYAGSQGHNQGTGIGLAIVKELTELLGGSISVESLEGAGASFTVLLPIHHQAVVEKLMLDDMPANLYFSEVEKPGYSNEKEAVDAQLPLILIIEDNPDVARFVQACLQKRFQIVFATNGQDGVEKALQLIPDLIISDVMMPVMDGFEALEIIKTNEKTSHIPIILLTARADKISQIEGLTRGADAYLTKPFHEEELLAHIDKLLELRRRLQNYYLKQVGILDAAQDEESGSLEENSFLQKVRNLINVHMDEVDYSVEQLSHELGMSHSQLHRKMVALTGHSVLKFIRNVKMQKARVLLRNSEMTIAEVAYDTGFSDPGYFTKVFVAEFGITPTEYRK